MKNKSAVIIVVVLVIGIIAVVFMQQQQKAAALRAQQQHDQLESAIALQYLQNQQGQQKAGVGDWLSTISSIGGVVTSIFGMFGAGDGGGDSSGVAMNALQS